MSDFADRLETVRAMAVRAKVCAMGPAAASVKGDIEESGRRIINEYPDKWDGEHIFLLENGERCIVKVSVAVSMARNPNQPALDIEEVTGKMQRGEDIHLGHVSMIAEKPKTFSQWSLLWRRRIKWWLQGRPDR